MTSLAKLKYVPQVASLERVLAIYTLQLNKGLALGAPEEGAGPRAINSPCKNLCKSKMEYFLLMSRHE